MLAFRSSAVYSAESGSAGGADHEATVKLTAIRRGKSPKLVYI
jgi:hypothetical protein